MKEALLGLQQENKFSKECTFHPKILKRNNSEKNFKENSSNNTFEDRLKM